MKVKMLHETRGSEDGFTVMHFRKNHEYDIAESLARNLIQKGVCEYIGEPCQTFDEWFDSFCEALRIERLQRECLGDADLLTKEMNKRKRK